MLTSPTQFQSEMTRFAVLGYQRNSTRIEQETDGKCHKTWMDVGQNMFLDLYNLSFLIVNL